MDSRDPWFFFCFEEGERFFGLFGLLLLPMFYPQDVLNSTTLLSHMLCPKFSLFTYKTWAKKDILHLPTKATIQVILKVFVFVMDQLKWFNAKTKS
jgi:hypothetical protein